MYPECMASVEKRRHDFRFIDEIEMACFAMIIIIMIRRYDEGLECDALCEEAQERITGPERLFTQNTQ